MSPSVIEPTVALVTDVNVSEDTLTVDLADGRTIAAPIAWYPRLQHGAADEQNQWRLIAGGRGIRWPLLANLLAGRPSMESQGSFQKWLSNREKSPRNPRASSKNVRRIKSRKKPLP
jgi:hypothetical protein